MGKPRSASAEAEDAPLVVDEHGNVVDLAAMENGEDGGDEVAGEEIKKVEGTSKEDEEKKGESGVSALKKKRKLGKVIGAGRDEEDEDEVEGGSKKGDGTKASTKATVGDKSGTKTKSGNDKKKKAKKIKLSFGDDEEEG